MSDIIVIEFKGQYATLTEDGWKAADPTTKKLLDAYSVDKSPTYNPFPPLGWLENIQASFPESVKVIKVNMPSGIALNENVVY
jgi:hypothetical protein